MTLLIQSCFDYLIIIKEYNQKLILVKSIELLITI
jgi:hypothetical protein